MAYAQWIAVQIEVSPVLDKTGRPVWIASCGRENASSGTQGSFDCYHGNKKIGTFRWDCPWASGTGNKFNFTPSSDEYTGQIIGGSVAGAIGELRLRLSKF